MTVLPFTYSYGLSVITSHLLTGASICLTSASVMDDAFWKQFESQGATSFAGVPRTFELLERSGFLNKQYDTLKYFTQAGGRLDPDKVQIFARYAAQKNLRFYVMYGQTEASPRMAYLPPEMTLRHPDAIGIPIPNGQFTLEDDAGRKITESNRPGELCYQGPNVMMGYATCRNDLKDDMGESMLRTGDIALRNSEGVYKIVGRKKRFVKIAGLRIGLDDIEHLLLQKGVSSKGAGDDTFIAVAVSDAEKVDVAKQLLLNKFKLPPNAVAVCHMDPMPTLSNGKWDYPSILEAAKKDRTVPTTVHQTALRRELASVLEREPLRDDESFMDAGGDSLNYIEASLIVEAHLGRPLDGWEKLSMAALEGLDLNKTPMMMAPDSLLVARAMAVALAMVSHCFLMFDVWQELPEALRLITRMATPTFLVLTGMVLARSYAMRPEKLTPERLLKSFMPKALTVYFVYVLVQLAGYVGDKLSLERFVGAITLANSGRFANILIIYGCLFLIVPLLLTLLEKLRVIGMAAVLTAAWGTWYLFANNANAPYTASFLIGVGHKAGPSLLQGLTFVVFGYALGAARKRRTDLAAAVLMAVSSAVYLFTVIAGEGGTWVVHGIASLDLRRMNHPAYYAFGIIEALGILWLAGRIARLQSRTSHNSVFNALGANSIFAYGFGNILLNLVPYGTMTLFYKLVFTAGFIGFLALLTFDMGRRNPMFFGLLSVALRRVIDQFGTARRALFSFILIKQ